MSSVVKPDQGTRKPHKGASLWRWRFSILTSGTGVYSAVKLDKRTGNNIEVRRRELPPLHLLESIDA